MKKRFLIVGANFENKGAQSMLFITTDELMKRSPDAEVFFASTDIYDVESYRFKFLYYPKVAKDIALGRQVLKHKIVQSMKDLIKFFIGRRRNLWKFTDLYKLLPSIDLIVDISGFNLGKQWDREVQGAYLDNLRIANKFNIPIVLLPQSFGPFDYDDEEKDIVKSISGLLPHAKVIYAREQEGFDALIQTFSLTNVRLSTDLVLQNQGINKRNVFSGTYDIKTPDVKPNSIGIVPNKQCFNHGREEELLHEYEIIINYVLLCKRDVYIFRHSKEDLEMCEKIFSLYINNKSVHLVQEDFSCMEYDEYVRKFDYIVCSRYHGIVHAYRNYIPCLILGWAIKYKELAGLVDQQQYAFDISDSSCLTDSNVINALQNMEKNFIEESKKIKEHITTIQRKNCFDDYDEWMNS